MSTDVNEADQDWRLEAELQTPDKAGAVRSLHAHLRGPNVVDDVESAVAGDVVITHDGELLFAYAPSEASLLNARREIEQVLGREQITARVRLSHWDTSLDDWRQTDPPLPPDAQPAATDAIAEASDTQTIVATAGRMIRAEFEQSMNTWAQQLGLTCTIVEHPHLLTTQVAFTVTGPPHKIDEFRKGLLAETWRTVRTESTLSVSPL